MRFADLADLELSAEASSAARELVAHAVAPALWTDEDVRSEGGETSGPATMAFKEYLAVAIQKGNAIVKEMMGVAGATVAFRKE